MNNFEQAHRQISKTVEIYEKNETTKTLKYMWALDALAVCALHKNDKHEYLRIKNRLFDSFKDKIFNIFPTFTEKNKEFFFNNSVKKYVDYHTAISLVNFSEDPSTIYNECILVKGLLLSASQKMKSRILESKDTALVNLYHTWKQQTEQIYQYSQKSKEEKSKEVLAYDSLENAWQETERLLNKKTSSFNVLANKKVYTWRDIQNSLKKSEAAVEIIRINKFGVQKIVTDTSDVEKAPNFPKYPVYVSQTQFFTPL
jgi:hypothetical protein